MEYFVSIIINLIIGLVFGLCLGLVIKSMIIDEPYHGPASSNIKKNIYISKNECFKLIPEIFICPSSISMK